MANDLQPRKCEVLELGRVKRSLSTSYFLNGQKLSVVAKHKHLGVVLSTKLSWSSHIDDAVAKARKVWGIILRTTRGANVLAKLQLYKSLVAPLLEYVSPVWSPYTKKDAQKLELVQRHVTKAILGYQDMDYETRLRVLGLVSLEERRRIKDLVTCYMEERRRIKDLVSLEERRRIKDLASLEERKRIKDLVTCYKYINGFTDVDIHYFLPGCLRTRSSHNQKLQIQSCHTNCFMFFFF